MVEKVLLLKMAPEIIPLSMKIKFWGWVVVKKAKYGENGHQLQIFIFPHKIALLSDFLILVGHNRRNSVG